jgi:hypothetical protein
MAVPVMRHHRHGAAWDPTPKFLLRGAVTALAALRRIHPAQPHAPLAAGQCIAIHGSALCVALRPRLHGARRFAPLRLRSPGQEGRQGKGKKELAERHRRLFFSTKTIIYDIKTYLEALRTSRGMGSSCLDAGQMELRLLGLFLDGIVRAVPAHNSISD